VTADVLRKIALAWLGLEALWSLWHGVWNLFFSDRIGPILLIDIGIVYLLGRTLIAGATYGRAIILGGAMFFWLPNLHAAVLAGRWSCGNYPVALMQQAMALTLTKAAVLLVALAVRQFECWRTARHPPVGRKQLD